MLSLFTLHVAGAPQISTRATEFKCGNEVEGSDCQANLRKVLQCVTVPAGVFGFYAWLCLLVAPLWNVAKFYRRAAKNDGSLTGMKPWDKPIAGATVLLTTLSAMVSIYQNDASITQCGHAQEFSLVRDLVRTLLASDTCVFVATVIVSLCKGEGSCMWAAGAFYVLAFAIAGLGGWLSYLNMLVKAGTLARSVHPLPHGPMAVCFVAWILVVFVVIWVIWALSDREDGLCRDALGPGCAFGSLWLVLSCAFGASGYVLLGTLAGDVWGTHWVQKPWGTVLAVVVPIVLLGNMCLYFLDPKPTE